MFLELLALSAASNASDASSNAASARNAALGLKGSGSVPVFLKLMDYEIEDQLTGIFRSKKVLVESGNKTINVSNIKSLKDGKEEGLKYTVLKTFTGETIFSSHSQDEIQQMIMYEVQTLAKLLKDA